MFLYIVSGLFSDFLIPTWEGDQLVQTAAELSFFNLVFRSILIIIYSDRCEAESRILRFFQTEEDMLWTWFMYLIYQMIFFRILGYFALYIQANYEKFNFTNYFNKIKNREEKLNHNIKTNNELSYDNQAYVPDQNNSTNIQINNISDQSDQSDQIDQSGPCQNQDFTIEINKSSPKTLAIAWKNLSYLKETIFTKKTILQDLNGKINFGTITALMGPSGAGKTTLLQCIYGIKRSGLSDQTEFYANKFNKIQPIFIVQDHQQRLLMNLTVRESLKYSSLLKNNSSRKLKVDKDGPINKLIEFVLDEIEFDHNTNIDNILSELMLTKCADNKVLQCSGGEQKRLSIGLELTPKVKPNLMYIDEPTTGLDSYSAEQVSLLFFKFICNQIYYFHF